MFDDRETIAVGTPGRLVGDEFDGLSLAAAEPGVLVLDPGESDGFGGPWRPNSIGPMADGRRKEEEEAEGEEEEAEEADDAEEEDDELDDDFDDDEFDDEDDEDFDDDDDEEDWDDDEES